jgi:hypothetical protein
MTVEPKIPAKPAPEALKDESKAQEPLVFPIGLDLDSETVEILLDDRVATGG